jgi:hypothetical protein
MQQYPADVCGQRCDERPRVAGAFERQAVQGAAASHEVLRVEHPHLVVAFAQSAGGVEDVAFVGGVTITAPGASAMTGTGSRGGLPGSGPAMSMIMTS